MPNTAAATAAPPTAPRSSRRASRLRAHPSRRRHATERANPPLRSFGSRSAVDATVPAAERFLVGLPGIPPEERRTRLMKNPAQLLAATAVLGLAAPAAAQNPYPYPNQGYPQQAPVQPYPNQQ